MLEQIPGYIQSYFPIIVFFGIALFIGALAIALPLLLAPNRPDKEKLSQYECGFEAFDDARSKFDIRFYLIAILFIIFDIEIMFLFPWALSLKKIGLYGFFSMMIFLLILVIGFIYEWGKGALEWE